jgi:hypothetical protein
MKKFLFPLLLVGAVLAVWFWLRRRNNSTLKKHLAEQKDLQNLNGVTSAQNYRARPPLAAVGALPLADWWMDPLNPFKEQTGKIEIGLKSPAGNELRRTPFDLYGLN